MIGDEDQDLLCALETSCDDSACALLSDSGRLLWHQSFSSASSYEAWGGIVPEVAARSHDEHMPMLLRALSPYKKRIKAVTTTTMPGLVGGLNVGAMAGCGLSVALGVPFYAAHHLEGHTLLAGYFFRDICYPYLSLLVSGGHTQWVVVHAVGRYETVGGTLDDALGEAFDKAARLLGGPYPGGPWIQNQALLAQKDSIPSLGVFKNLKENVSFSGLKTALMYKVKAETSKQTTLSPSMQASLAYAFEVTVCVMMERCLTYLLQSLSKKGIVIADVVACGGVAANIRLHQRLRSVCDHHRVRLLRIPPAWCTDNALMIAHATYERLKNNLPMSSSPCVAPRCALDVWPSGSFLA